MSTSTLEEKLHEFLDHTRSPEQRAEAGIEFISHYSTLLRNCNTGTMPASLQELYGLGYRHTFERIAADILAITRGKNEGVLQEVAKKIPAAAKEDIRKMVQEKSREHEHVLKACANNNRELAIALVEAQDQFERNVACYILEKVLRSCSTLQSTAQS